MGQSEETQLAVIQTDMRYVKQQMDDIKKMLASGYVTKEEHRGTVRRLRMLETLVYGATALILTAVAGAIISLVVIK